MQLDELLSRFDKVKKQGKSFQARCPSHDDKIASLSITEGSDRILLKCHAGCATADVLSSVGLNMKDLYFSSGTENEIEAMYPYHDENGVLLYEVVRFRGKKFRQRKADGTWGTQGVRRVLYNLPAILKTPRDFGVIYLVEGEKDADRITSLGKVGTTSPGGAGKFLDEYAESLRGRRIAVVADRDEPGYAHARDAANKLEGVAAAVRIVEPREGKDVSDHLDAGWHLKDLVPLQDESDTGCFTARRMADNFLQRLTNTVPARPFYSNPWGIRDIEFAPGGLYIIGGDTGLGKSNLALDLFDYLSEQIPCGYGSNEMTESELTNRLIAHHAGFGTRDLRRPHDMSPERKARATEAAQKIAQWQSMIFYEPEAGHQQVSGWISKWGLKFFIFDHLHLMDSATSGDKSSIDREIRGFKRVALKHDIPVLVVSQLRRPNPMYAFPVPTKHDFNGSSAIENASSIAMILFRPQQGAYKLAVVKNRDGEEPMVDLVFDRSTLRFHTDASSMVMSPSEREFNA